jgi:hypothetical protein
MRGTLPLGVRLAFDAIGELVVFVVDRLFDIVVDSSRLVCSRCFLDLGNNGQRMDFEVDFTLGGVSLLDTSSIVLSKKGTFRQTLLYLC